MRGERVQRRHRPGEPVPRLEDSRRAALRDPRLRDGEGDRRRRQGPRQGRGARPRMALREVRPARLRQARQPRRRRQVRRHHRRRRLQRHRLLPLRRDQPRPNVQGPMGHGPQLRTVLPQRAPRLADRLRGLGPHRSLRRQPRRMAHPPRPRRQPPPRLLHRTQPTRGRLAMAPGRKQQLRYRRRCLTSSKLRDLPGASIHPSINPRRLTHSSVSSRAGTYYVLVLYGDLSPS
mmetsp:Transcript_11865/g.39072  ORF Transcript_11865/g.39072 Transcript_11865/m.39072 type:complete len:233 (-) Transcript_11865:172-870(-)